jgi:hypothetical protein
MTGFAASSHQMQVKSALIFSKVLIVPAGCLAARPRLAQYEPETHGQAGAQQYGRAPGRGDAHALFARA